MLPYPILERTLALTHRDLPLQAAVHHGEPTGAGPGGVDFEAFKCALARVAEICQRPLPALLSEYVLQHSADVRGDDALVAFVSSGVLELSLAYHCPLRAIYLSYCDASVALGGFLLTLTSPVLPLHEPPPHFLPLFLFSSLSV